MEVPLDHPRFRTAEAAIFTRTLVPDCMSHRCTAVQDEHGTPLAPPLQRYDVCCQYGCDVDLDERARILAREAELRALMRPAAAAAPWFGDEVFPDADYPSGAVVRTEVFEDACIFLAHDQRGCVLHRAALEHGWELGTIKPAICRLFPLSYTSDSITVAEEYLEYSCARSGGPSLYRLSRDLLAELFGADLVTALDAAEARVLGELPVPAPEPRRLPVVV